MVDIVSYIPDQYHLLLLWINRQFPAGTHPLLSQTRYSYEEIHRDKNNRSCARRIRSRYFREIIFWAGRGFGLFFQTFGELIEDFVRGTRLQRPLRGTVG